MGDTRLYLSLRLARVPERSQLYSRFSIFPVRINAYRTDQGNRNSLQLAIGAIAKAVALSAV